MRKLGYERLDTGKKDDEIGWGINTSAGIKTWGSDVLKLQVAYGEGIGNYMNDGGLDIAPDSAIYSRPVPRPYPSWESAPITTTTGMTNGPPLWAGP